VARIQEGRTAPDFTPPDAAGKPVSLAPFTGKNVVVYSYPGTTGRCTKEACGFRDLWTDLRRAGVVAQGISGDSPAPTRGSSASTPCPSRWLSDPERKVMEACGAYGEKVLHGKTTRGVIRSSVWIGPDGSVKKHGKRVADPAKHPPKSSPPSAGPAAG
jgi:peroxiredoxin Q/BCP